MSKFENKWMRAVLPALLIHCSIGTVYCWSLFKGDIATLHRETCRGSGMGV